MKQSDQEFMLSVIRPHVRPMDSIDRELQQVKEENKQLKQTLKELKELLESIQNNFNKLSSLP